MMLQTGACDNPWYNKMYSPVISQNWTVIQCALQAKMRQAPFVYELFEHTHKGKTATTTGTTIRETFSNSIKKHTHKKNNNNANTECRPPLPLPLYMVSTR